MRWYTTGFIGASLRNALKSFSSPTQTRRWAIDGAVLAGAAILVLALIVGLATAADYGITIDEFNTDDYGPKALAWYTSCFSDRSQFETVEFSLWYYGPWFQMLTAFLQSLKLGDHLTPRPRNTNRPMNAGWSRWLLSNKATPAQRTP